ncbi:latent-transforming growth factor beta-binding protein 4-like [Corythoichthys intestinalis]|uniref:latent-transforming growth factor beta-binding protein 4-like n=1 Tax=Corythoichthys intestinalis TaxID=161448 RepID=UPI0025A68538|nr:latent-transforming growth factor beta-binding protein 4-like [Corythoichthys intestinalis]
MTTPPAKQLPPPPTVMGPNPSHEAADSKPKGKAAGQVKSTFLSLREAQAVLTKKMAAGRKDKMAAVLQKHIEKEKKRLNARTSSSRLGSRRVPLVVCRLLCKNGGVCLLKDRCLCPSNFTGKFCQIPVTSQPSSQVPPSSSSSNEIVKPPRLSVNADLTRSEFLLPLGGHNQDIPASGASMVKVRVQHPPEASVKVHQVMKVSGFMPAPQALSSATLSGSAGAPAPQTLRTDAISARHTGFKYCFREVKDGQCNSPLPGLRSKEMCCRGPGKAWGTGDCELCPPRAGPNNSSCPVGFRPSNESKCIDVNECQQSGLCENGLCVNTVGSYSCVCKQGFILDASHGLCISHTVISETKGQCHRVLGSGLGPSSCSLPILRNITKQICCCSRVGKAWGPECQRCPYFGSAAFKEICPAGPGYHYSASALQFSQRAADHLGTHGAQLITNGDHQGTSSSGAIGSKQKSRPSPPPHRLAISPPPARPVNPASTAGRKPQPPDTLAVRPRPTVSPVRLPPQSRGSQDTGHVQGTVKSQGMSHNQVTSSGQDTNQNLGTISNQGSSNTQGTSQNQYTRRNQGSSQKQDTSRSQGTSQNQGSVQDQGTNRNQGSTQKQDTSRSQDTNQNQGSIRNQGSSQNQGTNRNQGSSQKQDTSRSQGLSQNQGSVHNQGTNRNQGLSQKQDTGKSQGSSQNQGIRHTQGTGSSQGSNQNQEASRTQNIIQNQGTTRNQVSIQNQGTSHNQGTSQKQGVTRSQNQGTNRNHGSNQNQDTSRTQSTTQNQGSTHQASIQNQGTSQNQGTRQNQGTNRNQGSSQKQDTSKSQGSSQNQGISHVQGTASSKGSIQNQDTLRIQSTIQNQGITKNQFLNQNQGTSQNLGTTRSQSSSFNQGTSRDQSTAQNSTRNQSTSQIRKISTDQTTGGSQSTTRSQATNRNQGTSGSQVPSRNPGLTGSQDADECVASPGLCAPGECVKSPGGYRCLCPPGYKTDARKTSCQDVDECEDPLVCPGEECVNGLGSYRCVSCRPGFGLLNGRCADIDECIRALCSNGRCENTPGSFRCICRHGYKLRNNTCADVDECADPSQCPGQMCVNSAGSYRCVSCRPGYVLSNKQCTDINECEDATLCPGGQCVNTKGSYKCVDCRQGYRAMNGACEDVDECANASACEAEHVCVNTVGSFRCDCPPGYRTFGRGRPCRDIDECLEENWCPPVGECVNTPGSFQCVCPQGYTLSDNGSDNKTCDDTNECADGSVCGRHAVCQNLVGTYECVCDRGFVSAPDGKFCVDEDECESMPGVCGSARCDNLEGTFMCECDTPEEYFETDARRCVRALPPGGNFPVHSSSSSFHAGVLDVVPASSPLPTSRPGGFAECYYNLESSCSLLAANTSWQECCCTLGEGWGLGCRYQACPPAHTADFLALCPSGRGYVTVGEAAFSYTDVDECKRFHPEVCKNGVCVNIIPGYNCYCSSGFVYDAALLECVDLDECELESCEGGSCVNTLGSYYCSCPPPLLLDDTQQNCVNASHLNLDENLSVCWQSVSAELMCQSPLLGARITFTDCCCLYGQGWGMECALCPEMDTEDFSRLCSSFPPDVFPDSLGPGRSTGPPLYPPFSSETFPPDYEDYSPRAAPDDVPRGRPRFDVGYYTERDYEGPAPFPRPPADRRRGFGGGAPPEVSRPDAPGLSLAPLPGGPPYDESEEEDSWGPGPPFPPYTGGRPTRLYERRYDAYAGLSAAEDCGILDGCENGTCIRVDEGYTCDCYHGYRLDAATMTCIDINECEGGADVDFPCVNARCVNTDGSFRCVCQRGYVMSRRPNRCVPA